MVQEKLKRNIKSIGFIIVIYFSIVKIAKNTKLVKNILLGEQPYKGISEKILEIIFIWYFNFTDKLVT